MQLIGIYQYLNMLWASGLAKPLYSLLNKNNHLHVLVCYLKTEVEENIKIICLQTHQSQLGTP